MSDYDIQAVKSELVLEICRTFDAQTFIFGSQGKEYVRVEEFSEQGVQIHFQEYTHPNYNQMHGSFIPFLSVVDLLFNEGPKSLDIIFKGNLNKSDL